MQELKEKKGSKFGKSHRMPMAKQRKLSVRNFDVIFYQQGYGLNQ